MTPEELPRPRADRDARFAEQLAELPSPEVAEATRAVLAAWTELGMASRRSFDGRGCEPVRAVGSAAYGLALVVVVSVSVPGCGVAERVLDRARLRVTAAPTSGQLSPAEKLVDAAAKTNRDPITAIMRAPGVTADARIDPEGNTAVMTLTTEDANGYPAQLEVTQIDTDLYLRMPEVSGPPVWIHRTVEGLPPYSSLRVLRDNGDHTRAADLANCVVSAERKGGHDFTGLLDLTRSRETPPSLLAALGPGTGAVPFTARTSTGGHLYEFIVRTGSIPPSYGDIEYSCSRMDGVDVERPDPSQIIERPDAGIEQYEA